MIPLIPGNGGGIPRSVHGYTNTDKAVKLPDKRAGAAAVFKLVLDLSKKIRYRIAF
jgi:hypothetical protein